MTSLEELCKKYFNETDLYVILKIKKNATPEQVKKAYHKLSLKVHPDRVEESEKLIATEKFKVLGKIHAILSCQEKRAIYDEYGTVSEEDLSAFGDSFDWVNYWKGVFKPISKKDISDYEKKYKNSAEEALDLKKAYLNGKGDMDFILETVPFTNCDDEPRIRKIIEGLIKSSEVPEFEIFTNEPEEKASRRRSKWEKEAKRAEKIAASQGLFDETGEETLKQLIQKAQRDRGAEMDKFVDSLAAKYGCSRRRRKISPPRSSEKKRKRKS